MISEMVINDYYDNWMMDSRLINSNFHKYAEYLPVRVSHM